MATTEKVQQHLGDVTFPASKDDILDAAQRDGAPEDVLKALRGLPPEVYASSAEVARSADVTPGPTDSPARTAEKAHDKTHGRVAQHERDPG